MEAHYADHVAAALKDGRPAAQAHAFALRGMGNANAARRAFHKVRLTLKDETRLSGFSKRRYIDFFWVRLLRSVVFFASWSPLFAVIGRHGWGGIPSYVVVCFIAMLPLALWWHMAQPKVRRLLEENRVQEALWADWSRFFPLWALSISFAIAAGFIGGLEWPSRIQEILAVLLAPLGTVLEYRCYAALARKLPSGRPTEPTGLA